MTSDESVELRSSQQISLLKMPWKSLKGTLLSMYKPKHIAASAVIDRQTHNNYRNPAAHALRVNNFYLTPPALSEPLHARDYP